MKVFFNASVILAGLKSPKGGSGLLLKWVKSKKIQGCISEIVLEEAVKHEEKFGFDEGKVEKDLDTIFKNKITPAPKKISKKYSKIVVDVGDMHLLESSKNLNVDYLVSLDKKHTLSLKDRTKEFQIVSPKELIMILRRKSVVL